MIETLFLIAVGATVYFIVKSRKDDIHTPPKGYGKKFFNPDETNDLEFEEKIGQMTPEEAESFFYHLNANKIRLGKVKFQSIANRIAVKYEERHLDSLYDFRTKGQVKSWMKENRELDLFMSDKVYQMAMDKIDELPQY